MSTIISIIIAYLLGSISTSIVLAKVMKKPDPRTTGSGNAGATNVLRTMGKQEAFIVLIGDAAKGLIAVWIGMLFGVHGAMLGFVALAAVVGHIFPVFFKFQGGKGVATSLGVMLGLSFWVGIVALIIWIAMAAIFRYASLASVVTAASYVILVFVFGHMVYALPTFLIAVLVIWKHLDNINRLRSGTENKINF